MKLGNLAKFRKEYLDGYPLVNLMVEHFDIAEGYQFSAVLFNRPKGVDKKATAKIWLISKFGDVVQEDLELEFDKTEAERVEKALLPESFKVRPVALQNSNPKRLEVDDILSDFEDVIVEKVTANKTTQKKVWRIDLVVRVIGQPDEHIVTFELDFDDISILNSFSVTGTIELTVNELDNIDNLTFEDASQIPDFRINPDFINGSPPVTPTKNIIIPAPDVRILKLDYYPPEDVDSKNGAVKVEYFNKTTNRANSKWVKIKFYQSIREAAALTIKTIDGTEFRFLPKNRKSPPVNIAPEDLQYVGTIPNIRIVDIIYNYNQIEVNKRFIDFDIVVEFKTMHFRIKKVIEFAFSRQEYIDGTFREVRQESDSVIIPDKFLKASFLKRVASGDKVAKKELITAAKISTNYPYSKITDIVLSRFIDNSNLVIFAIKATESKAKDNIFHSFEKHTAIPKSLHEEWLEDMKPNDLRVRQRELPIAPDVDLTERMFDIPAWVIFESMQYTKPELDSKQMSVQLKLKTGSKIVFLEKIIDFEMSINEFNQYQRDLWEQDFLNELDPADLKVFVDTRGEPVDSIDPSQVEGLTNGISIKTDWEKPKRGKRVGRLYLRLQKGNAKIVFEQTIAFAKPTP